MDLQVTLQTLPKVKPKTFVESMTPAEPMDFSCRNLTKAEKQIGLKQHMLSAFPTHQVKIEGLTHVGRAGLDLTNP